MEEKSNWALGLITILLFVIVYLLFDIKGILKDIYSDTHYTSASADYLKDIKDILENTRR